MQDIKIVAFILAVILGVVVFVFYLSNKEEVPEVNDIPIEVNDIPIPDVDIPIPDVDIPIPDVDVDIEVDDRIDINVDDKIDIRNPFRG